MENVGRCFKAVVAVLGSLITYLFGGWSSLLGVLLTFVVMDYVTGLIAAKIQKELSSSIGFKGIAKKIMIFGIVAVGHLIDIVLNTDLIMNASIYFYLANELLSLTENAGKMGVPIPDVISNAIQVLNEKGEDL